MEINVLPNISYNKFQILCELKLFKSFWDIVMFNDLESFNSK